MSLRSFSSRVGARHAPGPVTGCRQFHLWRWRVARVPTIALLPGSSSFLQPSRAAGSSSSSSSSSSGAQSPSPFPVPKGTPLGGDDVSIPVDMPAPPRPGSYVPPAERDITDPSLSFLRKDDPLQQRHEAAMTEKLKREGVHLGSGQGLAPQAQDRAKPVRSYDDANAARLQSTSVHAGKPLIPTDGHASTVGSGEYYAGAAALPGRQHGGEARSRLHVLKGSVHPKRADATQEMLSTGERATEGGHQQRDTIFGAKHQFSHLEDVVAEDAGMARGPPPIFGNHPGTTSPDTLEEGKGTNAGEAGAPKMPLVKQIERDIKKLEYYHGSPQYPELLRQFREKYGKDKDPAEETEKEEQQKYTTNEVAQGLDAQPIDFHRTSSLLQAQLSSGPHGYSPVTIMQQHGVMRFQGYAFPPSTELGKLKGTEDVTALQAAHQPRGVLAAVRKSVYSLMGRKDHREDYLATEDKRRPDNHLLYRTLKLDAVQRRQMRFMLTDFDYKDRNTAFHVMMSYPYTDWIHAFFMVLVGWCLYQLQAKYGAYDFYDEYLGLDLRQVPSLKKPFLACITAFVMVFFLFQPLLVASIATNRAYRIVMRRPIGPP